MLKWNRSLLFKLVQKRHPLQTEEQNEKTSGVKWIKNKPSYQKSWPTLWEAFGKAQVLPSLMMSIPTTLNPVWRANAVTRRYVIVWNLSCAIHHGLSYFREHQERWGKTLSDLCKTPSMLVGHFPTFNSDLFHLYSFLKFYGFLWNQ